MFKFDNEVDAKLAIYEACMNGEITEAQKDNLMLSLNKKLGKVTLDKIRSGMKFKYAGDVYVAKSGVTYQTVSGVKIPVVKVEKEDGTTTNLQFDPEEDKAVRLVKESAEDDWAHHTNDEVDSFMESVNADIAYFTEAADAAGATNKVMGVIKSATSAVKGLVNKAKKHSADKKTLDELTYTINGLEGCQHRLSSLYKIWKKDADAGKESAKGWWNQLIKAKVEITKEIEAARAVCGKLGDIAKDEAKRLAEIEDAYNKMVIEIGDKISAAEAQDKKQ